MNQASAFGGSRLDRNWSAVIGSAVGLIFSTGMSGAVALSQYALALSAPFWGLLSDRFGPRAIVLPSVVILSALIASLSLLTPHLWHFYLLFAAIPLLAGGASPLGYSAVLIRQFERRLGLALGLALMGVGLGATLLPPLAQALVGHFGWRTAYAVLGLLTLLVTFPAALVATHRLAGSARPGLLDGAALAQAGLAAAIRSRPFVMMCIAFALLGIVSVGALAHLVPMLTDRGISPVAASQIAGLTGLAAVIGRGGLGPLLDRMHAPYLLALLALVAVTAFMVLALTTGMLAGGIGAVLVGLAIGAEVDFISFLVRRYFRQELFGRLYGIAFGVFVLGGGTGPVLLGLSFDRTGSYVIGLVGFSILGVITAALAWAMPFYGGQTGRAEAVVA